MKVHIDVHKRYAHTPPEKIRAAIKCILALRTDTNDQLTALPLESYRSLTGALHAIVLLGHTLALGEISDPARATASRLYGSWKRTHMRDDLCGAKIYLNAWDHQAWMEYSVSDRLLLINDFLGIGSLLEHFANEPDLRALIENTWRYWISDPESETAWRHISGALEAVHG